MDRNEILRDDPEQSSLAEPVQPLASNLVKRKLSGIEKLGVFFLIPVSILAVLSYFLIPGPPQKADNILFTEFYVALMQQTNAEDTIFKPFSSALSKGNLLDATIAAKNIQDAYRSQWMTIDRMDVPEFQNKAGEEKAKKAKELLADACFNRYKVIEKYIEFAKDPSISSIADVKSNADAYQGRVLLGVATLFEAAGFFGVDPKTLPKG